MKSGNMCVVREYDDLVFFERSEKGLNWLRSILISFSNFSLCYQKVSLNQHR